MPKLKQLPENAYETLCAELAHATTTPFGAWCALEGREAVGYSTHANFAQAAEGCERIGVAVFDELASYLRMRAADAGIRWILTAGDTDIEPKALRDPHAIGLLCLDHGEAHATPALASRAGGPPDPVRHPRDRGTPPFPHGGCLPHRGLLPHREEPLVRKHGRQDRPAHGLCGL